MSPVRKVALFAIILGAVSQVSAQERSRSSFESLDGNGDGKLSLEELSASKGSRRVSPERLLQKLDTDGDGFLSKTEFERMRGQKRA